MGFVNQSAELSRGAVTAGRGKMQHAVVTRISPGKVHCVDTELGDIRAPILVIALNAYAHKLGFV